MSTKSTLIYNSNKHIYIEHVDDSLWLILYDNTGKVIVEIEIADTYELEDLRKKLSKNEVL